MDADDRRRETMTLYNYTTGDALRTLTAEEANAYMAILGGLPVSERQVGAVDGASFGFPGVTVYAL
jgi:hypothetical protein